MYSVQAPEVVVSKRVLSDPLMSARLERMMACISSPNVIEADDEELARWAQERGWRAGRMRTGQYHTESAPALVFDAFDFDAAERRKRAAALPLPGAAPWGLRDHRVMREKQGCVCQTAWEIHCAYGCLHACQYCHVPPVFRIMMNLEELAGRVKEFGETIPEQRLYKFDNQTDQITLEPEYGASRIMVEMFADWPGRWLLLYTKSDNVDHLLPLRHRGRTLISWSLNSETACREIEKKTPSLDARLAAMEKCQAAGYTVRARLSPMIPLKNWREEYRDLVERLLARVRPDVITADVIGWMTAAQMKDALDTSLFDPEYAAALERLDAEGFQPRGKHLFPHELRRRMLRFVVEEIHRIDPRQPVSICMETFAMWDDLGPQMGMRPDRYACCCGPTSVPGHPLLSRAEGGR